MQQQPQDHVMQMNIKCKNRPPYKDEYRGQDGWNEDGTPNFVVIKNTMSKSCRFDGKLEQPGCKGCHWQLNDDPRDKSN
ncbi:hypothetical protein [Ralstonia pseudosolanacearum]|uniref:hypothetical protein n=1 Tax=Ralstonia pseudosolanacearum TaxID=1310165 RepID=UPI003CF97EB0